MVQLTSATHVPRSSLGSRGTDTLFCASRDELGSLITISICHLHTTAPDACANSESEMEAGYCVISKTERRGAAVVATSVSTFTSILNRWAGIVQPERNSIGKKVSWLNKKEM